MIIIYVTDTSAAYCGDSALFTHYSFSRGVGTTEQQVFKSAITRVSKKVYYNFIHIYEIIRTNAIALKKLSVCYFP